VAFLLLRIKMKQQKVISHSDVWQIAWPMIIANISVPMLGMVDTAVMGHLDAPHYLGAVAVGSIIFSFLFWGFGFLRMATTGLVAQATGKNNTSLSHSILMQSLTLAIIIASVVLLFNQLISNVAFTLIESSAQVQQEGKIYFDIRIWSTPAILINYVFLGWLLGKQASKAALILVLVVTVSNMILDLVFVNIFAMTTDGVALASVIAEYLGFFTGLYLLKKQGVTLSIFQYLRSQHISIFSWQWLQLHINIFIRTLCLMFSFAFFTTQGAKQGDIILAANAVLINFLTFMAFVLDGFANATEVITGRSVGKNDQQQLKQGFIIAAIWSLIVASLFSLIYLLFGPQIISLLTSIPEVNATANTYLVWLIILPLVSVWSYLLDGLFIGTTRSKEMRNTMLFSTFICFLPAWYLFQPLANHGLWLALLLFLAARGISQSIYLPKILQLK
jgi:MATE family multidrug resistance protein